MEIVIRQKLSVLVDECDSDLAELTWWSNQVTENHIYAQTRIDGKTHNMHRLVGERMYGKPLGKLKVDHISGDTSDNRRSNLRVVTHAENIRNRGGANKNSTTGHLGVNYRKDKGKYRAHISLPGENGKRQKMVSLGNFDTLEEAITARRKAEIKFWGEQPRRSPSV